MVFSSVGASDWTSNWFSCFDSWVSQLVRSQFGFHIREKCESHFWNYRLEVFWLHSHSGCFDVVIWHILRRLDCEKPLEVITWKQGFTGFKFEPRWTIGDQLSGQVCRMSGSLWVKCQSEIYPDWEKGTHCLPAWGWNWSFRSSNDFCTTAAASRSLRGQILLLPFSMWQLTERDLTTCSQT